MIPVVGLRGRMNLDPLEAGVSSNIVVLDQGGGRLGIVVDTVEAVVSAAPGQIEPAGTLLAGPQGAWVAGFFLQGDRVIALLDSGFLASLHHLS